ncbi:MAG: hypothetical protein IV100_10820 [Myxococcales bacterium]|nr:hypothetical protein [Myxococcales bacterium]
MACSRRTRIVRRPSEHAGPFPRLAFLLAAGLFTLSCRAEPAAEAPVTLPEQVLPPVFPEPTPVRLGGMTTDGKAARADLNARIDGLGEALAVAPDSIDLRRNLVDTLLARTAYFGTYTDFDTAMALADEGVALAPKGPDALLLRAQVLSSVHRFAEARSLAAPFAATHKTATRLLETIDLALGQNLEAVLTARAAEVDRRESYSSLAAQAVAQAALGRFDEADQSYRSAIAVYRDVSPLPHASVAFQRGVMWAEVAGDGLRAVPLYREALDRLPGYVVASVHLAELEAQHGLRPQAIARLRALVDAGTGDPEPAGLLSELLAQDDPAESQRLASHAAEQYDRLLGRHRAAFLDHAAEFFAGPGKAPKKALKLALENVALRPTERAYLVAVEAALAAGDPSEACRLAAEAPRLGVSVPFRQATEGLCPAH